MESQTQQSEQKQTASTDASIQRFGYHWIIFRFALGTTLAAVMIHVTLPQFQLPNLVVMFIALGMWGESLVRFAGLKIQVRQGEIIVKRGFLNAKVTHITRQFIKEVTVEQTLPGKIFNYGKVAITYDTGEMDRRFTLNYFSSPHLLEKSLEVKGSSVSAES